ERERERRSSSIWRELLKPPGSSISLPSVLLLKDPSQWHQRVWPRSGWTATGSLTQHTHTHTHTHTHRHTRARTRTHTHLNHTGKQSCPVLTFWEGAMNLCSQAVFLNTGQLCCADFITTKHTLSHTHTHTHTDTHTRTHTRTHTYIIYTHTHTHTHTQAHTHAHRHIS